MPRKRRHTCTGVPETHAPAAYARALLARLPCRSHRPAAVYYPVRLYLRVYTPRKRVRVAMQVMNVAAAVTSVLAVIGAVYNITTHVEKYTLGRRR